MKLNRATIGMALMVLLAGCGGGGGGSTVSTPSGVVVPPSAAPTASSPTPTPSPAFPVPPNVSVAPIQWTSIGPRLNYPFYASGEMTGFAMNPAAPSTIYVSGGSLYGPYTSAGVFKSVDGGASFVSVNNGLADRSVGVLWLSADGTTLLAGTNASGIYRSTDGANSWSSVLPVKSITSIVSSGSIVYATTGLGVSQSADGGATWSTLASTTTAARGVAIASGIMYFGTSDGKIMRSQNGGPFQQVFTAQSSGGPTSVNWIALDALTPQIAYAVTQAGALLVTKDGGATWNQSSVTTTQFRTTQVATIQAVAMSAVSPHTVYVGTASASLASSTDQGTTWATVPNSASWDMRSVFTYAANGETIAIGSDHGIYMTTNGGASWKPVTANLSTTLATGVAISGQTIVVVIQDFTAMRSFDGGATWNITPTGATVEAGPSIIHPKNSKYCYIYVTSGFNYSTDSCVTYTLNSSVPTSSGFGGRSDSVGIDQQNLGTIYVATSKGVYVSNDYGITFRPTGWPFAAASIVAVDPSSSRNIFVSDANAMKLSVSHDGGATWLLTNLPTSATGPVLSIHPSDSRIVVASTPSAFATQAVYRSTDGGNSFQQVGSVTNNPLAFSYPGSMRFNPQSATPYLALASQGGVFVSTDYGGNWSNVTGNAIATSFGDVTWSGGILYAASFGQGVLKGNTVLQSAGFQPQTKLRQ